MKRTANRKSREWTAQHLGWDWAARRTKASFSDSRRGAQHSSFVFQYIFCWPGVLSSLTLYFYSPFPFLPTLSALKLFTVFPRTKDSALGFCIVYMPYIQLLSSAVVEIRLCMPGSFVPAGWNYTSHSYFWKWKKKSTLLRHGSVGVVIVVSLQAFFSAFSILPKNKNFSKKLWVFCSTGTPVVQHSRQCPRITWKIIARESLK